MGRLLRPDLSLSVVERAKSILSHLKRHSVKATLNFSLFRQKCGQLSLLCELAHTAWAVS